LPGAEARGAARGESADIVALLSEAVREAGALALAKFGTAFKSWTKGESSPVSEVDIAVDELLRERLGRYDGSYGWLSEETADDPARLDAKRVWIVDPIDGTRGFIAGKPDWTVVAALVEQGRPICAAVYAPVDDQLFLAQAGAGATLNGSRIAARDGDAIEGSRVNGAKRRIDALASIIPTVEVIPRLNSLALRLARVAEGRFDIVFSAGNSHDWDLAASDLLVHEAGGVLTDFDGRQLVYNRPEPVHGALIAAGQARHPALLKLVHAHRTKFS
jgi:myo-inositol-1(or 4)-monophosphatase